MRRNQKLSLIGMLLGSLFIVLVQLIWLFDPWRADNTAATAWYWLDSLDWLVYAVVLLPVIWLFAGLEGINQAKRQWRSRARLLLTMKPDRLGVVTILIYMLQCIASIASIIIIIWDAKAWLWIGLTIGAVWLLVMLDLLLNIWRMERKATGRFRGLGWVCVQLVWLGIAAWPTGDMVTYPGLTMNMNRYVSTADGSPKGSITGVLVFERPAFLIDKLYARLWPHYQFERIESLGMSLGDYGALVRLLKADANTVGTAIAYEKAGLGEGVVSKGVRIAGTTSGGPAEGILQIDDVIVSVNGETVKSTTELIEQMNRQRPGDSIAVAFWRGDMMHEASIVATSHPERQEQAALGIHIQDALTYDLPSIAHFHSYYVHEGGPSHGAMLAFTLLDQLVPGGVTGNWRIAGTGTIEVDGRIGLVGGVRQKAYTISRTDAEVFFVPKGTEEEARLGAPQLHIVPVETLDDIIHWIQAHPKDAVGA